MGLNVNQDQSYNIKTFSNDTVLNYVQKYHISLQDEHIKHNNQHLRKIITEGLIPIMRKDPLFKDTYRNINYAGSFFKGTKVGKPDEFDLDLVIRLPLNYTTLQVDTNHEHFGYVKIKVETDSKLPKWNEHGKILNKWLDDSNYLNQTKFYRWMEGIMTKTFEQIKKDNDNDKDNDKDKDKEKIKKAKEYELTVDNKTYVLKPFKKSGPAFTIFVGLKDDSSNGQMMDVDMVPCLEFDDVSLKGYKVVENTTRKLLVVAKLLQIDGGERLWRLSFYEQEKQILLAAGKIKPVIRLLKKFRDKQDWKKLASYYIETLCLHELDQRKSDRKFLKAPLTSLFIHMLKKLADAFAERKLPYFWHTEHNLIEKMDSMSMSNYENRIKNIISKIETSICGNNWIVAEYLLEAQEVEDLRRMACSTPMKRCDEMSNSNSNSLQASSSDSSMDSTDGERIKRHKSRVDNVCEELSAIFRSVNELSDEEKNKLRNVFDKFFMNDIFRGTYP